jgi:diguanylate cyclase (GGDEF)-like protein
MPLHLPTLLYTCIAALVLSAGLMSLFGSRLKTHRGFWHWTTAQWLLALGLLLQTQHRSHPWLLPVSTFLLLQAPITVLVGLRRFYSRHGIDVPVLADGLVLGLACMAWLAVWVGFARESHWIVAFMIGMMVLHFYAAALIGRLREFKGSVALQSLAILEVMVASLLGLRMAWSVTSNGGSLGSENVLLATSLLSVIPGLLMVYLGPLMSWERTEHALRAKHRKLRFLADMDVLTRVPNRRRFHELAAASVAAGRPGAAVVMMLDIDHFKHINDLHGHASGDEALRQVAHCVRKTLREQDVAGRLGGDEFSLVLPDTEANDAINLAARITALLSERQAESSQTRVSLSFGIVQMNPNETMDEALRRADQALYEAKRQGRSRAVVATGAEAQPVFSESRPLGLDEGSSSPWSRADALSA